MSYYLSPLNRDFTLGYHNYAPFSAFDSLIDRVFDNALYSTSRHLALDETDDAYSLSLELPGFKQSEVEVTLNGETLTVAAKKGDRSYQQSVTLPRGVDADKIEARLEDGLLSISLPKSALAKPRKIALK